MQISANFIKGIANILREDAPSSEIFVTSLKKKREELNKEEFENLYRNIVISLRGNNLQLLENLIDDKVIEFFAQRILDRIEHSNNTRSELGRITLEDVEIACFKSDLESIQAVYLKILLGISKFISGSILKTNIKIDQEGIRAFLTNYSLPWLILRTTLALHRQNKLQKGNNELRALYRYRLFQYYVFLKTLPKEHQEEFGIVLTNGTVVTTILWVLEKENLDLSEADSPFRFRGLNNVSPTYQIGTLLEEIFSKAQEYNEEVLSGLEIIENYDLLYSFLAELEKLSIPSSQNMKLLIAEQIFQNLFKNKEILKRNKRILVDFTKFLREYGKEKYTNLLKELNRLEPDWSKQIIKENLENKKEILWEETARFLILEPNCALWDKEIRNMLKSFLWERLTDEKFLEDILQKEEHWLTPLLERFIKYSRIKLNLDYLPFGKKAGETFEEYLKGEEANERLLKLLVNKLHRFLKPEEIETFLNNILDFVKDSLDSIDIERFEMIMESGSGIFKQRISQDYLENIGRKIIDREFPMIPTQVFLNLVKLKGNFKDEINLKANVERYMESENADQEIKKILEELLRYVK